MSTPTSLPPGPPDEKEAAAGSASARALAEVSESLNGLRELASRVQGPETPEKPLSRQEQFSLELAAAPPPPPPMSVQVPVQPPPPPVAARAPKVGESLREAREHFGFTLEEVAEEVKIKLPYLRAIEEGRYGDLPQPAHIYAIGFVRNYAQALGLHVEELTSRCRAELGNVPKKSAPLVMPKAHVTDNRLPGGALITACVVLAIVVYALSYNFLRPTVTSEAPGIPPAPVVETASEAPAAAALASQAASTSALASTETAAATPDASAASSSAASPAEEKTTADNTEEKTPEKPTGISTPLEKGISAMPQNSDEKTAAADTENNSRSVEATEAEKTPPTAPKPAHVPPPSRIKLIAMHDTEVQIVDEEGHVLAERVVHKGEAFYVPDHKHYTLATRDAGAVRLSVDGRDIPPLGAPGEAMHNIPLDPHDLLEVMTE